MAIGRISLTVLLALSCLAVGCGDNDNGKPEPNATLTPAKFTCTGPEGPPAFCHEGNVCCGAFCTSPSSKCCTTPPPFKDAGQMFVCRSDQECCGPGCIQTGSPCT